ncbi:MAG: efflux RND transporter periplasmic adaptor subunit [Xanthobacteraceae bacterium]
MRSTRGALVAIVIVARTIASAMAATAAVATAAVAQPSAGAAVGMAVTVTKASRTCFTDTLQVSGILVPREEVFVRPETEGLQVSQILVEDGERVTAGQNLARLVRPEGQGPAASATVRAPAAGIVNHRGIRIGMTASARADPLFRIIVNSEVELQGDVPGTRIAKLAPGQTARVELAGVGEVTGRVRVVAPEVDLATQLGRTRISLGNDEKFKVGAYARAIVEVGRSCGATIPLSAVLYGPEGAIVQVVRDDRVETRRVRVGLLSGGNAEIREGLNEGDMVIARAGAFLREGDRVRPILAEGGAGAAR